MAKISDMAAAGTLTGTELVEVVQDGVNRRSTTSDVAALGGGGGGGGVEVLDSHTVAGSSEAEVILTWSADHPRVRLVIEAKSTAAVTVSADNLRIQLGDDTDVDTGSNYGYGVRDVLGNSQTSLASAFILASRYGIAVSATLFSWAEMVISQADQFATPMYLSGHLFATQDAGRSVTVLGTWEAPTGPLRQIRLTLEAGSFVVGSTFRVETTP